MLLNFKITDNMGEVYFNFYSCTLSFTEESAGGGVPVMAMRCGPEPHLPNEVYQEAKKRVDRKNPSPAALCLKPDKDVSCLDRLPGIHSNLGNDTVHR